MRYNFGTTIAFTWPSFSPANGNAKEVDKESSKELKSSKMKVGTSQIGQNHHKVIHSEISQIM